MAAKRSSDVTASEVGSWAYCALQLWHKERGSGMSREARERLRAGTAAHHQHGVQVDSQQLLYRLLWLGGTLLLLGLGWWVLTGFTLQATDSASPSLLPLFALAIGLFLGLLLLYQKQAQQTGMQGGWEVIASDTGQNRVRTLYDPETGLKGKPDYLIRRRVGLRKRIVPAELKPTRRGRSPYPWDRLQLATYIHLTLREYGEEAAPMGLVRYATGTFPVHYTAKLQRELLRARDGVREVKASETPVPRSHRDPWRCEHCPFRSSCSQSLA